MTEYEAYKFVSTIIQPNYNFYHKKCHQDDNCAYEALNLSAKVNIQADKIVTYNARKPINTHLITSPIAIYIANKYIPYNVHRKIRYTSQYHQAKHFLATKYN